MTDLMGKLLYAKIHLEAAEKEKIVIETKILSLNEELERLGYKDVKSAQEAIASMESEISDLEDTLGEQLHDFEHKYSTLLED
jgi:DNA helicase IV